MKAGGSISISGLPETLFALSLSQIKGERVSLRKQHSMSSFSDQQTLLKKKEWWQESAGTNSFEWWQWDEQTEIRAPPFYDKGERPSLGSSCCWFLPHAGVKPEKILWSTRHLMSYEIMPREVVFAMLCLSCCLGMSLACKSSLMIESQCCPLSHHVSKLHAHSSAWGKHAWCLLQRMDGTGPLPALGGRIWLTLQSAAWALQ